MLRELEAPHHQAEWPLGCFSPRAGHSVVELGVFECGQVEGQRLFENHLVDPLSEKRSQELLARAQSLLRACQHRYQPELHQDPSQCGTLILRGARLRGTDHGVDDQLSDPGRASRKNARHQAQEPEREAQTATRRPHESDPVLQLTKHTEQLRPAESGSGIHRPSLRRPPRHAIAPERAPWYEPASAIGS
jgi:hypothetical protein